MISGDSLEEQKKTTPFRVVIPCIEHMFNTKVQPPETLFYLLSVMYEMPKMKMLWLIYLDTT